MCVHYGVQFRQTTLAQSFYVRELLSGDIRNYASFYVLHNHVTYLPTGQISIKLSILL